MAGEWIKMRVDLADDPAVIRIRRATGVDADAVVGKLHRLWSWADVHTADGYAVGLDAEWVDEFAGCHGFAAAMVVAGWLSIDDAGVRFANFDRHNGQTAKVRALGKNRMKRIRCAGSATLAQPEEEKKKRREEEIQPTTTTREEPSCSEGPKRQPFDPDPSHEWEKLREAWNATPGVEVFKGFQFPRGDLVAARCSDPSWLRMYPEALARLPSCRFFDRPVSLRQFLGEKFVGDVLCGTYDHPKSGKVLSAAGRQPRKGGL